MRKLISALFLAALAIATPLIAQTVLPTIDGSGTVTTGGTSQVVFQANPNRVFLRCQNPTATLSGVAAESLFINYDAPASATAVNSEEIINTGSVTFSTPYVPLGQITITAATTGHKFVCKTR